LGSHSLRLTLDRLSADWQARYGHPVVLVETFVDPEQFCGTVYSANGWQELGTTDGFGRVHRDFYVEHHKPKRLFARQLCKNARRSLAADQLKPALASVEAKTPRAAHTVPRKSVRWSSTSKRCPTTARASAFIRCGAWSPFACWPICAARPAARRTWRLSPKA
jgi:hypothetical protein